MTRQLLGVPAARGAGSAWADLGSAAVVILGLTAAWTLSGGRGPAGQRFSLLALGALALVIALAIGVRWPVGLLIAGWVAFALQQPLQSYLEPHSHFGATIAARVDDGVLALVAIALVVRWF